MQRGGFSAKPVGLRSLAQMVTHLNDDHFWTREHIASWVASVEPQEVLEVGEANQESHVRVTSGEEF